MRTWLPSILAGIIAIVTAVTSTLVAFNIFERMPHLEDEFALLWQAEVMASGEIAVPSPDEPEAFLVPFVVDADGLRFGKYPPGWPAALSLGARADLPWIANSLLAGFTVWLIYRLGCKIAGSTVGVIAAGLAAISPMLLMLSGSLMPHTFSLFLSTVFILAWLDLFSPGKEAKPPSRVTQALWMIVAGLAAGLLVLTRPLTAVGILLPFITHGLFLLIKGNSEQRRNLVTLTAITGMTSIILLVWNGALTGDPLLNPYALWWPYDRVGFGPGIGVTESGHTLSLALNNTHFSLRAGQHDLFGWPYLSWVFIPFGLIALRRNLAGWLIFATFPALVLVYSAYWIGSWLYGPRYYFESLAGLAVISAVGICWLASCLPGQVRSQWRLAAKRGQGYS